MDYSPPGSFVSGISQARMLESVAISFSRESSWPRDQTHAACIAGGLFPSELPGKLFWLDNCKQPVLKFANSLFFLIKDWWTSLMRFSV